VVIANRTRQDLQQAAARVLEIDRDVLTSLRKSTKQLSRHGLSLPRTHPAFPRPDVERFEERRLGQSRAPRRYGYLNSKDVQETVRLAGSGLSCRRGAGQ
jgi:hypothetical protein